MKIQTEGFKITDICPQVPMIEVSADGDVILHFFAGWKDDEDRSVTDPLSKDDLTSLQAALTAARNGGVASGGKLGPRLTEDDVYAIRRRLGNGESARVLAADFSVSEETISHIRNRRTWAHLPQR